jgi:hypothetical protein
MELERVQRWVMSGLLLTTAFVLAGGLALLTGHVHRAGSTPGLLAISCVVGVLAVAGVRGINQKPVLTPWLLLGLVPALLMGWLVHGR